MLKPKEWILEKNLSTEQLQAVHVGCADYEVIGETEKAYKFKISTDFGKIYCWAPKSQCVEIEDFDADEPFDEFKVLDSAYKGGYLPAIETERYLRMCKERGIQVKGGLAYNHSLVEFAKANHVKGVRKGMKTSTLIQKIEAAGLAVPQR